MKSLTENVFNKHEELLTTIEQDSNLDPDLKEKIIAVLDEYKWVVNNLPTEKVTAYIKNGVAGILYRELSEVEKDDYQTFTISEISKNDLNKAQDSRTKEYANIATTLLSNAWHNV